MRGGVTSPSALPSSPPPQHRPSVRACAAPPRFGRPWPSTSRLCLLLSALRLALAGMRFRSSTFRPYKLAGASQNDGQTISQILPIHYPRISQCKSNTSQNAARYYTKIQTDASRALARTLQKIHGSVYCLAEVLLPRPRAATPATAMSISSGQASAPHPARPPLRPHACTTAGCPAAVLQLPGRPAPLACALGSLLALLCCGRCISVVHLSSSQLADACIPAVLWLCCCSRRRAASLAMPRLR